MATAASTVACRPVIPSHWLHTVGIRRRISSYTLSHAVGRPVIASHGAAASLQHAVGRCTRGVVHLSYTL